MTPAIIILALLLAPPPAVQRTLRQSKPGVTRLVLTFGDSKSMADGAGGGYQRPLQDLTEFRPNAVTCGVLAKSGYTAALWRADIDADLAGISTSYDAVLVNLGANDVIALPLEATWKTNMGYVLDALHAKWPNARIIVMKPWKRAELADCTTLVSWLTDLLATRAWALFGPDERLFLENGDDGATYATDGTHPNGSGYILTALQWRTSLGY